MKKTFRRLSAIITTAIMTVACGAISASANDANASLAFTEAKGIAGQCVTVDLVLDTDNSCTGYNFDVTFDSRLELVKVDGVLSTETDGNVVTLINFTGSTFEDNTPVSSLTFEIPADAAEGTSYDLSVTRLENFCSDNGEYVNPTVKGTSISVLESAKKVTNNMVFVTKENGLTVSKVAPRGDADMDGEVGVYDAIAISKMLIKKTTFDDSQEYFADVNQDGKADLYDVIAICRYMLSSDKTNAWAKIISK